MVLHSSGSEQSDRPGRQSVNGHGGHDDRTGGQRLETVLRANGDRQAAAQHVLDERDHEKLLFEDRQDLAHSLDTVERVRHVRTPPDEDLLPIGGGLLGVQRGDRVTHELGHVVRPRGHLHDALQGGADQEGVELS